jgi:hypothetical protein
MMTFWFLQLVSNCVLSAIAKESESVESNPRYAVMQFDGVTELPRGSQFTVDSNSEWVLPPDTVIRPVRLIVAVDLHANEVWLFARMSPWRLDTGVIDVERDYLWHQRHSRWDSALSSIPFRCVFLDLISMSEVQDLPKLVENIARVCRDGLELSTAITIVDGDTLRRKIPSRDGKNLVVNLFRAGEVRSAVRAVVREDEPNCYDLLSIFYSREKPVEIRRGKLRVTQSTSMPEEIELAQNSLAVPSIPRSVSRSRINKDYFSDFAFTVLWFSSAAFLSCVICCQFLFGATKNVVSN